MKKHHDVKIRLSRTIVIVLTGCMLFIMASTITADPHYPPNEYTIPLQHQWNLITVPVNASIAKDQITVRNNSIDYNFTEAVNHRIIVGTLFGWDRENQTYFIANDLGFEPGKGYWLWAYYSCSLIIHSDVRGDGYITKLLSQWNIMGQTYNSTLALTNLSVLYNGTSYSWANATSANNEEGHPLIINSIFKWNGTNQWYDLSTRFTPGEGYWMYAYHNCSLKQIIDAPVIIDNSADTAGTGNSYVCNASVSDPDGVKSVWLEYWYAGSPHLFVQMNPTGVNSYYEKILTIPSASLDSLHYIIAANDTKNYWNNPLEQTVIVHDDDKPIITNVLASPSSTSQDGYVNISCDATDNIAVNTVRLHLTYPDLSITNISMNKGSHYYLNQSYSMGGSYQFFIWANDTSSNVNTSSVHTFTITFNTHMITASAGTGGSITPSGVVVVNHGGYKNFTIAPNTGYHIVDVLVDGGSIGAVSWYNFSNVVTDHTVAASFEPTIYTLTITKSGTGSGTVQTNISTPFYYGVKVKLWANASTGSMFSGWSGALSGTDTPQTLIITDNTAVDAQFTLNGPYTLTITKSGNGSGMVEVNNSGPYYYGAKVKLWANASSGSLFTGWSGVLSGTTTPQILIMNANKSVDAQFTLIRSRGWIYYKKITVNHSQVNQSLVNFPILVSTTDTDLVNHAQPDARDVQFWDVTNTTRYHHEIEKYNQTTGEFIAWVNVTYLSATQDTIIWMKYGNTTCGSQENIAGTWDGNYIMVQHLNETGNTLLDSTAYGRSGTNTGTTFQSAGKIDGAREYNDDDYITVNNFSGYTNKLTAEAWIYRDATPIINVFCEGKQWNKSDWILYLRTTSTTQGIDFGVNNHSSSYRIGTTPVNTWFYLTAVYNAGNIVLYVNSTKVGSSTITSTINNKFAALGLGNDNDGGQPWASGKLDELRISKSTRNNSWVKTCFNTMSKPSSFIHIGVEEEVRYTLSITMSGTGSGTVELRPSGPYYYGAVVKLWANASVGSLFTGWSGALTGTITPQTLVMDTYKAVDAAFRFNGPLTLTTTKSGSGSGTIETNISGPYSYGAVVKLWANASSGSTFTGWSGALNGTITPQTLTMDANKSVDAHFIFTGPYIFTITKSGTGSGTVERNTTGPYYYGAKVKLWANASTGSTFVGWSGALSGIITPQTLTMDGNTSVDARFNDTMSPTISLNFAGNPSDSGGPYYLPGTNTPAPEGYYTNASYQKEKWIQIKCTATDNVGIEKVWLHWRNGTQWTNNTYQLTHTTGNYYEINMSTNIAPGPKYSFDLLAVDTSGNTMLYRWLKIGADTTAVDDRRYVQLGGTPTNISYTPYYFYPAQYKYTSGYGPGHNMTNDDILHHDQGPDGTLTDSGYLLGSLPTSVVQERHCIMYVGYWFDETVTAQPGTIRNIYHHFWWHTNNSNLTVAYGKSDAGFYRTEAWGKSYNTNITQAHSNISYNSITYYLESALMKISSPKSFTDNDIYEFFVEYYTSTTMNPAIINNRSIQSFVVFNVPDNTTIQGQDIDADGLTDYQELYVTFTNPFVQDTDNDGFNDYIEYMCGSNPNDYKAIPTSYPVFSAESPQNQSIAQPLNPSLSITVGQAQSYLMNVTFLTNATGSWQTIGTNLSVLNGRYSQTPTTMNNYNTTYYWSIHCNAGTMWTNKTYSFTTKTNQPPVFGSPNPANASTGVPITTSLLSVTIQDPDGDPFDWTIKGQYVINTSQTGDSNGIKTANFITPLPPNTNIIWSIHVTDPSGSGKWTNATYSFTTESFIPTLKWSQFNGYGNYSAVSPLIADVNGDGKMEVVRSGINGIIVYDGATGDIVWMKSQKMWNDHVPIEIIDLNKDNFPEIICSYENGTMAIHGNNGSTYWYNPDAPLHNKYPVAGDIDADGYPEVYVCSHDQITALTHDGHIFASTWTYYPCFSGFALGDTDYDGVFELYFNERSNNYPTPNTGGDGVKSYWASNLTKRWTHPEILASSHCPTLVDTNKDGRLEVVALDQSGGGIYIYNSTNGNKIHGNSIAGLRCHSQPTIYDIDGDGNLELIACRDSQPIIWDLYTWTRDAILPYSCQEPPAVADITGDGKVEILACHENNIGIYSYNNVTKKYVIIGTIPLTNPGYYGMAFIVAQDVDNDGLNELIFNRAATVYVYDTIASALNPRALTEFGFYSQHRGRSPYYVPYGPLAPIVKNESPLNKTTDQPLNPPLSVYIYDYQHNLMNITFSTNASTGLWHNIQSEYHVSDGTVVAASTEMGLANTIYWWRVIVTDSTGKTTSKLYKFTTAKRHLISNPTPSDSATNIEPNPMLSAHVEDLFGDSINIIFMTNATGSWVIIGSNMSVGNGTYYQQATTMNMYNTTFYWRVSCFSGGLWTNKTFRFTSYKPSSVAWWNSQWMYRSVIKIDHTKVNANLKDFPVLISITSNANLAAHAQLKGDDIVFTDVQGNKLNHEIELYTNTTGRLVAWVNVTNLSSTTDTQLFLYYGNSLCSSQQNPSGTWNADYLFVHHMNETGTIYDSTSHGYSATNTGTTTEPNGKIDGCRYFDSTTDQYNFGTATGLNPGMNSWTISLWTKIVHVDSYQMLCKYGSAAGFTMYLYNGGGTTKYNYIKVSDGVNSPYRYWNTSWSDGNWHYINAVINRNTNKIDVYLDGTLHNGYALGNLTGMGSITTTANFLLYGGTNGRHDEFTISTTVRNSSWIKTCFNNQNDPASFYWIYPEQLLPSVPPSITNPDPNDGATNLPLHPTLQITVSDDYNFLMNIIWKTNASGTWTIIGTNNSANNGVYFCSSTSWTNSYHKKYWWKVEVNDNHGNWNNKTYSFTTITVPPTQETPVLASKNGTNTTYEDLICSNQSTVDLNGLDVYNTYHWLKNNNSLTNLLLSFNTENHTSVRDHSGYNNNGIISGATWTPDGVVGGAYAFYGADSPDYISIPDSTTLDGGGTWTAMTIEHWIYLTNNQTNSATIAKMANQANNRSYQIGFQNQYNRLLAGVYIGSDNYKEVTYDTPLLTGVWYHVALTYQSGTGVKLYLNGVSVATIAGTGNIQASTGNNLCIGCRYGTQNFFDGSIDEVKIYPYALTTEQIHQNYLESTDGLSTNSTIVPEETSVDDVWQCDVTPSNGVLDGITKASNPLTIVSSWHTIVINTIGNGIVTKNPDYTTYPSGTVVNLTATPDAGWFFSYWSGDLTGNTNQTSITMDATKNITATFIDISGTTTTMEDIDSGLTSPTGDYRWKDIANQNYSENYRNSYNYTQANVEVTYYTVESTLHGFLNAVNLKPNFAYQLKLVGTPGTPDNERIGLVGRWWQEEWDGTAWANGQNLNNKGDGSSPNPNDNNYSARKVITDGTSPTGLHFKFTGYLLFDYFITDEQGNATIPFETGSCYHVLWETTQRSQTADDGPIKTTTFVADTSSPAYDVNYSELTIDIFGEWERIPVGGIYLPSGSYSTKIMLTEESFHGTGEYDGNWAAAMSANIQCTIVDIE